MFFELTHASYIILQYRLLKACLFAMQKPGKEVVTLGTLHQIALCSLGDLAVRGWVDHAQRLAFQCRGLCLQYHFECQRAPT